jgi:hypothetical protein
MRCRAHGLAEVEGELAIQDFLDAVSYKIALEWGRSINQQIIRQGALGLPTDTLEQISRIFGALMHEHIA